MTPENADMAGFFVKHWERLTAGTLVLVGFIYKTGIEHQKYTDLQKDVVAIKKECEERECLLSKMNINLHLIMNELGVKPVEGHIHHRREDGGES